MQKDGQYYVLISGSEKSTWREVPLTVGIKGPDGQREIISGLNEGDQVVSYGNVK